VGLEEMNTMAMTSNGYSKCSSSIDDQHDVGMSKEPRKAIEAALGSLGGRYPREMAESAELEGETR
jgi:hypothetical protein